MERDLGVRSVDLAHASGQVARAAGTSVAFVGHRGAGQGGEDAVSAGGLQIVYRAGQRRRYPDQLAVWVGDDLHVDAVTAVFPA